MSKPNKPGAGRELWNNRANNSLTVSPDAKREANTSGGTGSL